MSLVTPKKGYKSVPWLFGKKIEIPDEWEVKSIKELGEIVTGNTPDTTNNEYYHSDFLWASPIDLQKEKYVKQTNVMVSKKGFSISRKIPKDSVLVVCIGSTIGKIGIASVEMSTNQQINSIICNENDSHFIYYQLLHNNYLIKNIANQSAIPILNKTEFGKLKLFIPTKITEQQKIATILSNVDNLIESTGMVITNSKKVKKGLMQKLLTQGIGHTKFKKVPWLFGKDIEIPEEWEVKKTDDIFDFLISGTNARSDLNDVGEIHYIHYGDIHTKWNNELNFDSEKTPRIDKEKVSRLPLLKEGDLIIADASEDVEGSGTSISLKNIKNKKIVAGLHTLVLRRKDETISFEFMKYLTSISYVKIQITSWVTGAKVFGLNKKSCKEIKVPLPPLSEQQKIATILSNIDSKIESQEQYKENLQKLKKSLMQKLLTGEVRV
ncbi:putative type-1 restriction enzyme MjaXP specificity protein [Marine Group I thaumarchaeote SCGC AAA799-P11]|uniref:Putative type-1 restriction enzyme MjaXP specificity protein n=1 Tax=Marine Group I thaumarchaeote SCGC AAA799-P11 TaxID=1502295 RepID=A0A087S119_9ARCH|nr:putative type-1 restriction enzyme MjaXP specificity protein [Marine Group I thaumarchaeote SCGC AAA799-P11]